MRAVLGNAAQQRDHRGAQHARLVDVDRVDRVIRRHAVGADVFVLARNDVRPHGERALRRRVAELHVARDAADQPQIHRRNHLAVRILDLLLDADVQLDRAALGQILRKDRVQRVDALHDDKTVPAQIELPRVEAPLARRKIIGGQHARPPVDHRADARAHKFDIERIDRLIIALAARQHGHLLDAEVKIVERDDLGLQPERREVIAQQVRRRRLSA